MNSSIIYGNLLHLPKHTLCKFGERHSMNIESVRPLYQVAKGSRVWYLRFHLKRERTITSFEQFIASVTSTLVVAGIEAEICLEPLVSHRGGIEHDRLRLTHEFRVAVPDDLRSALENVKRFETLFLLGTGWMTEFILEKSLELTS